MFLVFQLDKFSFEVTSENGQNQYTVTLIRIDFAANDTDFFAKMFQHFFFVIKGQLRQYMTK